jgi:ubiquitin C-terminal hydrolase
VFTDKIETVVDFPLKGLDLTNYMPPALPPGMHKGSANGIGAEDPRVQIPPYKYDLYGVTNHFGSLGNGHCELKGAVALSHFLISELSRYRFHRIGWRVGLL